jgi:hypothetical protein
MPGPLIPHFSFDFDKMVASRPDCCYWRITWPPQVLFCLQLCVETTPEASAPPIPGLQTLSGTANGFRYPRGSSRSIAFASASPIAT